ncbi:MAG: signal peptidase I [Acidobacteria bacterium]|nr:signal peptidase I [Acidobacteriota bacterium]MBS1866039.1 signal peptidase I [Acidobacteriota bacterium]
MTEENAQQDIAASATETPVSESVAEKAPPVPDAPASLERVFPREKTTFSEYIESLLVTVILALFGTSFIVQAFKIPSPSMEKTLLVGDHLLVNKFIFGGRGDAWYEKLLPYRPIQRGDIIVFKYPYDDHQHFVKRVIGLPGDHLKMVDQEVYINGKRLFEPYVVHDPNPATGYDVLNYQFPPVGNQFLGSPARSEWIADVHNYIHGDEIVIPKDKYFAMGDNRDRSSDSRYWGFVDHDAIMGRPFLIYWSVEATSDDYSQSTFLQRLGSILDTLRHLPARTRWNRMFHTVH